MGGAFVKSCGCETWWLGGEQTDRPCAEHHAAQLAAAQREIERLKVDQSDWRKGVGFIASAAGCSDTLVCVAIGERVLEMRAELERAEQALAAARGDALDEAARTVERHGVAWRSRDDAQDHEDRVRTALAAAIRALRPQPEQPSAERGGA